MPPLAEDGDLGSGEDIPFKGEKGVAKDGSEDDDSVDEYVIEDILSHTFDDNGGVLYEVKWEGYDKLEERTWEPEANLASAPESLEEYWRKIGGRPTKPAALSAKGSKKRKAADTPKSSRGKRTKSETPEPSTAKRKKKGAGGKDEFKLPKGSWEEQVATIDTIEEAADEKGDTQRYVYILWKNGSKTRHQLKTVNEKCPQKMLAYYENHLVFRSPDAGTNDDDDAAAATAL